MCKLFKPASFLIITAIFTTNSFAEIVLSGEFKQGALVIGKTSPKAHVTFDGKVLELSTNGDYVFGFGRDDNKKHHLVVKQPNGLVEEKFITPEKRQYKIQRIEGIAKRIMNPNPKNVARSKKDSRLIKKIRKISSNKALFSNGFAAPIKGVVTGVYGSQRVYNGVPKRPHFGLDYAGKTGDDVFAPASGTVLMYVADMFYSGGTMIIDHGQGVSSTFLHLSDTYVKVGDVVKQGQKIAAVGASGRATGPHLDWRINWFDTKIDPAYVLRIKPLK